VEAAGVELDRLFRNRPVSEFAPKIEPAQLARSAEHAFHSPKSAPATIVDPSATARSKRAASSASWRPRSATCTASRPAAVSDAATNDGMGTEQLGLGPSVVVLTQPGHWTIGMTYRAIWSASGATDRKDVNQTLLQPLLNYNLGNGLAVGVSSEASAHWKVGHA